MPHAVAEHVSKRMAYEVLARKYRSRTFDEIVGQSAIATTLKNAVESGRVHHAYLFTGTRGVGKTSMARILAKSLNCFESEKPTPSPCCKCESCIQIAEGNDLDVVEIDAASNTGVDNIRELRSNAAFRPARSRFKVYIIDEVHMLSTGAFNALLKTLEEPPEHVKFVLATTESHKVPATIRSRCQRFGFRSIEPGEIAGHIKRILDDEGVAADEVVIRRIARLATGSMRDGLSLLDQLLSYGSDKLTAELIEDLLPAAHDEVIFGLLEAVAGEDPATALRSVDQGLTCGYTCERLCETIIEHLRTLMLLALCGTDTDLVDVAGKAREQLTEQSAKFDGSTYVHMIGLMEQVRRQVKSSAAPRPLLEAAVVRLALSSAFSNIGDLLARIDGAQPAQNAAGAKKKDDVRVTSAPRSVLPDKPAADPVAATTDRAGGQTNEQGSPRGLGSPRGSGSPPSPGSGRRQAPVPAARVSSADKEKVMRSPLVQSVLELADGLIIDVRKSPDRIGSAEGGNDIGV